ncbi:DUF5686 family protein [Carboxylicivirga sp. N1Y90]|uniref:DUF5686 and carboxypeptidase-like regulatory domain-containing protein n=1 Tax=Carboxylicivirga fragile TaxID=3417571 RepID=UPI003D32E082|nr:carboxypeptidase-like regulatory domain-containing protein [Marinilabiliaceae bacterium N1Y90]
MPTNSVAQELTGQVVDALTDQGIPFVNVVYGDQEGTITDIDGKFRIRNLKEVDHLQFSCLGYYQHRLAKDQITPYIYVELKPLQYQLDEINILPGENPALLVMRKVVENSKKHNPSSYDPYSCIIYHKMNVEFDLPKDIDYEQLPPEVKQFGINKDSYLMLFESVSEKRHLKKGIEKERIISGRVSGLRTPTMASLPALLQPFSFYDQYVKLLDREYLNPASKAGLSSYKFQLLDTLVNSVGDTIHYISYQPKKNRNFRGLTGTFHIHASSSAIKTVAAKTTGTENGLKLFIRQNYQPVANGLWFPKQLESSLEFGSIGNTNQLPYPLIGTGKSYVTAINTEPGFSKKDFDNITLEDASILRSAPNVGVYRYEPLSAKDSATYHLIDSLGRKAHLDAIINMQLSVVRGYIPAGNFQFDLRRFIDYNDFEGLKLGMGLYTSPRMSENFSTGGFFSYGFGDKTWKYGGEIQLTPHVHKENKYIFEYRDDVFATGSYSYLDGINKRSSELFRGFLTETMDRTREFKVGTEFRFFKYFKSGLYYRQANVSPQKRYIFLDSDQIAPDFDFKEAEIRLKWAHRETFTKTALGLISEGTKYPMVWLNFAYGEGVQNRSFEYNKVEVQLEKTFRYPNAMYSTIRAQGGKLDGDYPSTFLYSSFGSYKSFTIHVANTFGTMRLNEFAADEFTAVYLSHGIPLSLNTNRRVKPEIVLNTNIAWGTAPDDVSSFDKGYYESGIYFKNILSSYMLQYGLSVHYRYGPYQLENAIDNWAFKLGLEFGF